VADPEAAGRPKIPPCGGREWLRSGDNDALRPYLASMVGARPNHVLPTARSAAVPSDCRCSDFMKPPTTDGADEPRAPTGPTRIGPAAETSWPKRDARGPHGLSVRAGWDPDLNEGPGH